MNTKESFPISAFRMLLSVLSLVIIIPMVNNFTDISFYVSVSVYVLGKFIDLIARISQRQMKVFFRIYICGTIFSIVAVAMCFFGFANMNVSNGVSNTLLYNNILLYVTTLICFIDVADFVFCVCKLSYTKKKLHQFINISYLER